MVLQPPQCICKTTSVVCGRFTNAFSLTNDIGLLSRDRISNLGRLLKTFSSIFDMSLLSKDIIVRFGRLLKALFSITDIRLLLKSNRTMLKDKFFGILSSVLLLQLTTSPEQTQRLGHADTTPTSKITAPIVVIRNSILRTQS